MSNSPRTDAFYAKHKDGSVLRSITPEDGYEFARRLEEMLIKHERAAVSETSSNVGGPYGWRSCESNHPAWDVPVLVWFEDGTMYVGCLTGEGWSDAESKEPFMNQPAQWRRLPEAPHA